MELYVVPDWLKVVAGLVVYQPGLYESKVLLGLRSARSEEGKWCLPTGQGAIRRDITSAFLAVLAGDASKSSEAIADLLKNPLPAVQSKMSERQQQALLSPAGFAIAEAQWYTQIHPLNFGADQLVGRGILEPLKPICQLSNEGLLVKIYFELQWRVMELPEPAATDWPFKEVRFFSRKEIREIPVAFGCDKDLEEVFWSRRG